MIKAIRTAPPEHKERNIKVCTILITIYLITEIRFYSQMPRRYGIHYFAVELLCPCHVRQIFER